MVARVADVADEEACDENDENDGGALVVLLGLHEFAVAPADRRV